MASIGDRREQPDVATQMHADMPSSLRAPAGCSAEARAGAELRAHPALRLRLHPLHGLSVLLRLQDCCPTYVLPGSAPISGSWRWTFESIRRAGSPRSPIWRSSPSSTSSSAACSASAWRSCSTRRSAAKACCGRSISIRWRFPSSSPASPGSGSSIPASASSTTCTTGAGRAFHFDWIKNKDFVIYTIVIAGVWQSSGFVMAMFLAGLRGVDNEIIKAAQIDGASTFQLYRRIIIPLMRPVFLSAFVVLAHLAIKSYDLVVAMTERRAGRPRPGLPSLLHVRSSPSGATRWRVGAASADHHADDDLRDHRALSLFRAAGRSRDERRLARRQRRAPHRRDHAEPHRHLRRC